MTSRLVSRPSKPPTRPANDIDNYDVDDDDPFADSGDEAAKNNGSAETQSKKRKDASGLGIDEAVSVSKKPRVPRVKLDETRLLSDNGIPKLRAKARSLHFKGKGHEFSDTARLLSFYQLWLDDLFPKAKFLDALSMVEKAGHKNQLRLKRIQWIDEGRPRAAGELQDGDDHLFGDSNQPEERDPAIFPARIAPIFQNSVDKRARTPVGDDPFADDDDIYDASPRRPTTTTTAPATTSSMFGNGGTTQADGEPDEDDLDALMAEEEAQRTTTTSSLFGNGKTAVQRAQTSHGEPGDDDDLDALMAEAEAESSAKKPAKPANSRPVARAVIEDEEDDLDALMAEAEAEGSMAKKQPSQGPGATNTNGGEPSAHEVDEDAEAAMAEMEGLW
ncbi:replication fork protection component Swi3-domain-containing protein [Hypoxylon argillaceum]|nr:replication fork protection component Swi3-domain-containing protein [Hypoxylon argillaceum]